MYICRLFSTVNRARNLEYLFESVKLQLFSLIPYNLNYFSYGT